VQKLTAERLQVHMLVTFSLLNIIFLLQYATVLAEQHSFMAEPLFQHCNLKHLRLNYTTTHVIQKIYKKRNNTDMVSENIITNQKTFRHMPIIISLQTQKFQNMCIVHEQKTMLVDFFIVITLSLYI
jgi:hypothetical protein